MERINEVPSEQQLKQLYEAAIDFKKAKPWEWMWDSDLICVENPESGEVGYCSVMGKSGVQFALGVFLGDRGYAGFNYLQENAANIPAYDIMSYQDCLMCSFEDRELLEKRERDEIKNLGLTFRGRNAWPQFRRFQPGYFPWFINQKECVFLTHALREVQFVATQYRLGEIDANFDEGKTVLRHQREVNGDKIWQSQEFDLVPPVIRYHPVEFGNDLVVQRIKRTNERLNLTLQAETCYLPTPIQEEKDDRPYFPRVFILADKKSGMIVDYNMYEDADDDASEVLNRMVSLFLEKGVPKEIQVKPGRMAAILENFCQRIGVRLKTVDRLANIEYFLEEMEGRF